MCLRMIYDGIMDEKDEETFKDINQWFEENLPNPLLFRTGDQTVITYFKLETIKNA